MKPSQFQAGRYRSPSRMLSVIPLTAVAGVISGNAQTTSGSIAGGVVDQQQSAVPGAPRIDNNNRPANYGPQDFDRRHNFNVNWVYELPRATRGRSLGLAFNDWQFSGIYRYQTGAPYNISFTIPGLSGYGVTGTSPGHVQCAESHAVRHLQHYAQCYQPDQPDADQPGFGNREQDWFWGGHRGASAAQHADLGPFPIQKSL